MRNPFTKRLALKTVITLSGVASIAGALWWALFALKPYDISADQLAARYAHSSSASRVVAVELGPPEPITVGTTAAWAQTLRYITFDGTAALGCIVHPADPTQAAAPQHRRPVILALHAMGRRQARWWHDAIDGRRTIESTHRVSEIALQAGHVVVALDARGHGDRKDTIRPLIARELLRDLHLWGDREPYERLIVDTVKDYRVLLDWVERQPQLDATRVRAVGYSMGAQMALLLAGTDGRVRSVAAMVPPHLDRKVAAVAPATIMHRLADVEVWLLTGDEDEYASRADSLDFFAALPSRAKRHLRFPAGHLLPPDYVEQLRPWLQLNTPAHY